MRVATWNVNGLRARLEFVLRWLEERAPDLVALQELKLRDEDFPESELRSAGFHALVHGQKAWNGVAILSREPAELLCKGLAGQEDLGSRLIVARLGDLTLSSVYVPNGKDVRHQDFGRKLAWLHALRAHFDENHDAERPDILCGDFNVVPAALDTWDEEGHRGRIFHTDVERDRLRNLLDWGFADVFRDRHPDSRAFSWWDYRGGAFHRGHGLRIDLLLATPAALARVRSVEIDRDYRKKRDGLTPSDHAPVIADLD